jgi:hypothetical protein
MNSEYKSVLKQFLSEVTGEKQRMAEFPAFKELCRATFSRLILTRPNGQRPFSRSIRQNFD